MSRLEEIKKRFNAMNELEGFKKLAPTALFFDDLNWLIEQAERVHELEEKNRKLDFAIGRYSLQVSEISQMIEREVQGMKKLSNRMVKGESE